VLHESGIDARVDRVIGSSTNARRFASCICKSLSCLRARIGAQQPPDRFVRQIRFRFTLVRNRALVAVWRFDGLRGSIAQIRRYLAEV